MLTKEQKAVAKRAAELIRKGWCKDWYAGRNKKTKCPWTDPEAKCFCASGAIMRASWELSGHKRKYDCECYNIEKEFVRIAKETNPGMFVISAVAFNDKIAKKAEDVAKIFDSLAV